MAAIVTRGELASAVRATVSVAAAAATPDPLKFQDLALFVDQVVDVAQRRIADGNTPRCPSTFVWPKDHGASRVMTYLDPFDEVVFRALVGRFVRQMEARVDSSRVLAAKLARSRPFWRLEPHGRAVAMRTERAIEWLDSAGVECMATLDIENYFYDITPTVLARSILLVPGPGQSKAYLTRWLQQATVATGVSGLPVGHQPSSVLANHLLLPTDHAIGAHSDKWMRYMDDTWLFAPSVDVAHELRGPYEAAAAQLHLKVNEGKWMVHENSAARDVVRSPLNEYLDASLHEATDEGVEDARHLFEFALESPDERRRELRRALTVLRKRGDAYAVDRLKAVPALFGIAPDHWGFYLSSLVATKQGRRAIDQDWLTDSIKQPRSGYPDAERLVVLRVLANGQPSKDVGRQLLEMAMDRALVPAVRVRAAACWGRAKGWKRDRAAEAALAVEDPGTRRSLVSTLKQRSGDPQLQVAADRLRAADPDLEPTLRWIAA